MFKSRCLGRKTSRQKASPAKRDRRLAVEHLEVRLAPAVTLQSLFGSQSQGHGNSLFVVPGQPGEETTLTFEWTGGDSSVRSEVGVFVVDGPNGRVNGVKSTQANYARRALLSPSRNVLFARGEDIGASEQLTFKGGQRLAFYLIRNGTADQFLARNPTNQLRRSPVALFSVQQANPDRRPHMKAAALEDQVTLRWEDFVLPVFPRRPTREAADFNDFVFRMTISSGDTQPPTIIIASPTQDTLANRNIVVSGQVTDDHSGVALLQAQLDGGAPFDVAVDSQGAFQFTTALPLSGAADGPHSVNLSATDGVGNTASSPPISFTLFTGGLSGSVSELANAHIPDLSMPRPPVGDRSIDDRPDGTGLETSRTRLMVQFRTTATVNDANAVLHSLGARILGTVADINLVLIGIPDTGDFSGLDHALTVLDNHPAIALVVQDVALGKSRLPETTDAHDPGPPVNPWVWSYPPSSINESDLDGNWGLEAVRAPEMWNLNDHARRSTGHPRTGVLDAGFNDLNDDGLNDHSEEDLAGLRMWQSTDFGLAPGAIEDSHGEHVAGIIGAGFDNGVGVDGINPFAERHSQPDSHFVGVSGRIESIADTIDDLRQMLEKWPDLRVINISLGYILLGPGPPGSDGPSFPNANTALKKLAEKEGLLIRQLMARYPETFLVTSAGNDSDVGWGGEILAKWTSPWNWAGLGGDETDENGILWPNSPNILVVESLDGVVGNPASPSFSWQYSKSDFSNIGGSVAAPGGRILSTVGENLFGSAPITLPNYATLSGTSMAAPHVTGLIGYLLSLDPGLTVQQIRTLITDPAFTRSTVFRHRNGFDDDGDGVVDDGNGIPATGPDENGNGLPDPEEGGVDLVSYPSPAPMIDAFAAALGIDLLTGDSDKSIQRALVDVDDGTLDGNLRVDPFTGAAVDAVFTPDGRRTIQGDGKITMRDFRAWRDAFLQTIEPFLSPGELGVVLDGGNHVKKDLNFNGVVAQADDVMYPRYDFNGDGSLLDWSLVAPFKIDPDTPPPPTPLGLPPLHNTSTDLQSLPGFLRDIDVLADPAFWSNTETDFYNEGVTITPAFEGAETAVSNWTESRYLLANRDPDSASDFQKYLPDYIHSFDVHVSIDWGALDFGHDAVLLRIDSEMAGPDFAEHFRREAVIPVGTADFVVTIPIWTGRVQIKAAGFDVDGLPPNLDSANVRANWSGLRFGEDRALVLAPSYELVDLGELDSDSAFATLNYATALNDVGQIVGVSEVDTSPANDGSAGELHAFFYDNGQMVDLGTINGGNESIATDINNAGFVVGYASDAEGLYRAFTSLGDGGAVQLFGPGSEAYNVNESSHMVGRFRPDPAGTGPYHGFRMDPVFSDLGTFTPSAINDLGAMVGRDDSLGFGIRLRDGSFTPITADAAGILNASIFELTDINNVGQIVGSLQYSSTSGAFQTEAFVWENGQITLLGRGGFPHSRSAAINEAGLVVGLITQDPSQPRHDFAVMWKKLGNAMVMSRLDDLLPDDSPWHLSRALDINNRGDIVGEGAPNGELNTNPGTVEKHPFLLTARL